MERCPRCGQDNAVGARFCSACANPLATTEAREERKIITVLFADLVGFTARADGLDPEDVRAILRPYHARLRTEIEAFGGTVEKFIGDAVVGIFGAPVAHGDDPERAVRAALSVRGAIAEMNAADQRLDLHVRVAVNTGEAIVSLAARPDIGEGMVAGDVVNTASRLQTAAPSNGILVGEATYRATRTLFDYEPIEPMLVKGKDAPLHGWLALEARAGPGERTMAGVPMVGRLREMGVLDGILERAVAEQRPHLVTVFGEAGVGKTRLAAEFTARLEGGSVNVLRGRCLPYGASTLYGPFTQHVKEFAGIFASDDVATARDKLRVALDDRGIAVPAGDELASHLALLIGLGLEDEVSDRQILFFAARRFAELVTHEHPTVFVFEDLHWADLGTFDLLEHLASRVRGAPIMLLALARPDLLLARPGWGGGLPAYSTLSLEALGTDDSRLLAASLLRSDAAATVTRRVAEKAEGNPLFIEELAASAVELTAAATEHLPTTIRELVSARLDALPASERHMLLDAAVVGKVFWRGALERIHNGTSVSASLDSLEARDLIRRESSSWIEGDEQFTFKHVLIRDVAYATLPRETRKERHAAVAEFLEACTAGAGATATALALHWREAGHDDRALEYLLIAADQAGKGWAKDEAAQLYGEALRLIPEADTERRRGIARKRTMALVALSHVADARSLRHVAEAPPEQ